MDEEEILAQFISCTGTDVDFAKSFLEDNGWDLNQCVELYLNAGGTPTTRRGSKNSQGNSPRLPLKNNNPQQRNTAIPRDSPPSPPSPSPFNGESEVRAPILPVQEVLVTEDPYAVHLRKRAQRQGFTQQTPKGVFEMFRNFNEEGKSTPKRNFPETESQKKLRTLAQLFRPPVELLEPGSFEDVQKPHMTYRGESVFGYLQIRFKNVKQKAFMRKKWLLVNIQTITEFDCQRLNRDTWSDTSLKSLVAEDFVLWQVLKESEDGARYCRFYPVAILPHIAIIDSRTGERLLALEGFIDASRLKSELLDFTKSHHFEEQGGESVEKRQKRKGDVSEEQELMAAIAASLDRSNSDDQSPPADDVITSTDLPQHSTTTSTPIPAPAVAPITHSVSVNVVAPPLTSELTDTSIKEKHSNPSAEFTCTIQIRLPSGQIKGHFRPSDALSLVYKYTALHLEPGAAFTLFIPYPKRSLTGDILSQTLQEAGMLLRFLDGN